ncbi:unnamed protein product [Rhodiola kirilowii]
MSDADSDKALYNALLLTLFLIAPPVFISLRFLQALTTSTTTPDRAHLSPPPSLGSSWNPQLSGSPSTSSLAAATPLISNPSSLSRPTSSTSSIAPSSTSSASTLSRPIRSQSLPWLLVSTA